MHHVLRIATIEHMRDNADFYRQYMAVNSVRRNPKRTTTAALPTRIDTTYYTEEQLQQQFEQHVEKMGQPGKWADNMEVSAFASALNVHVRLWQADYTYLFSPRMYYMPEADFAAADDRQTLHIAYHVSSILLHLKYNLIDVAQSWEHYSSVRNVAGPHTGRPKVHIAPEAISKKRSSPSVEGDHDDQLPRARKRRSPLPAFDSDSTPEGTESSSDESNGPMLSQQPHLDIPLTDQNAKPQKLTLKLRGLRTTDPVDLTAPTPSCMPTSTSTTVPTPSMPSTTTPRPTPTPAPTVTSTSAQPPEKQLTVPPPQCS